VSELQGVARFRFHEGKLEEFKRLAARCMEIVRTSAVVHRAKRDAADARTTRDPDARSLVHGAQEDETPGTTERSMECVVGWRGLASRC
jgi:hypothetical protein